MILHALPVCCSDDVAKHTVLADKLQVGLFCVGDEQNLPAAAVSAIDTSLANKLKELNQSVQQLKDANR